jgi:sialic acid synthase SpsE
LISRCAATRKPLVISTGMASLGEVHHALAVARVAGARHVALLHCVSAYPVPRGSENLLAIRTLQRECRVPVGLSDHGEDTFALPMAIALGASLYERHLVLDDDHAAVDRAVSSTPAAFAAAVGAARRAWAAMGTGRKACLSAEGPNLIPSRRALCVRRPIEAGTTLSADDLIALRPALGISPAGLTAICGRRVTRRLAPGDPVRLEDLETMTADARAGMAGGVSEAHRVA